MGDSYSFTTNVAVDNVSQNVYGAAIYFIGKGTTDDADSEVVVNCSTNNGQISISGSNNNVITVTMNANVTANYPETNVFHWALRCVTSGGQSYTLDRGRGCISNSIVPNS